jgi:hypothetical protein
MRHFARSGTICNNLYVYPLGFGDLCAVSGHLRLSLAQLKLKGVIRLANRDWPGDQKHIGSNAFIYIFGNIETFVKIASHSSHLLIQIPYSLG